MSSGAIFLTGVLSGTGLAFAMQILTHMWMSIP